MLKSFVDAIGVLASSAAFGQDAKVVVLYGHPKDPAAFDKYYAETHAPMVRAVKTLKRFEVAKAQPAPNGNPPAFYLVADILFESLEALNATRATDEWQQSQQTFRSLRLGALRCVEPKK
jgi:uncharacterized protein (TIGR02118 family)